MKIIAAVLLALVAVCAAQRGFDPLRDLQNNLRQAKSKLDLAIDGLVRAKRDAELQGSVQMNNKKGFSIRSINELTSKHIDQVKAKVDELKAEGKDASKCLQELREAMNAVIRRVYSGLDGCVNKATNELNQALRPVEDAVSTGRRMMSELDSIFPSCFSGNSFQMQTCIAVKLGTANQAIRNYENNVNTLKRTASSAPLNAALSVQQCSSSITNDGFSSTTSARMDANRCVEAA